MLLKNASEAVRTTVLLVTFLNCHPVSNLTCSFFVISAYVWYLPVHLSPYLSTLSEAYWLLIDPFFITLCLHPGIRHVYLLVKMSLYFTRNYISFQIVTWFVFLLPAVVAPLLIDSWVGTGFSALFSVSPWLFFLVISLKFFIFWDLFPCLSLLSLLTLS